LFAQTKKYARGRSRAGVLTFFENYSDNKKKKMQKDREFSVLLQDVILTFVFAI
jgi:hypothetical protein